MHGERVRVAFEPARGGAPPRKSAVHRVMESRLLHPRVRRRVPHIHRFGIPARRQDMKIALAFEPELVPGLAAIFAAQQAKGVDEARAGSRMTTAVDVLRRGGEAHVVVLRAWRLRPSPVLVDREAEVARDHQPRAIDAVGEPVHVDQGDLGARRA